MSPRFRYSVALTIGFFALLAVSPPLSAEVREKKVCVWSTSFPDADEQGTSNNDCFTGHTCIVGVRGKWLDLTDHITVESGPNATVSNYHHGVGDSRLAIGSITTCVPQGSNSEGFISLKFTPTGTGTMRIKMTRPSLDGGDQDIVTVNVLKGDTFIATNTPLTATDNEPKELRLTGGNLNLLQLKNPSPGDEILEKTDAVARVRLTFAPGQSASLDTRLQFAGPEPAINARYGWPMVRLSSGGRSAPPAAVTGPNVVPTRPTPGL